MSQNVAPFKKYVCTECSQHLHHFQDASGEIKFLAICPIGVHELMGGTSGIKTCQCQYHGNWNSQTHQPTV